MEQAGSELPEGRMPKREFTEWLAEWARDNRRQQHGLLLTSAHRAKGLEFDHVVILDHEWQPPTRRAADIDELRRLYYVAMTRARLTLTLCRSGNTNPFLLTLQDCEAVVEREAPQVAAGAAPRGPQQDRQAEPERHVSVLRRTEPGPADPRGAGGSAARRPTPDRHQEPALGDHYAPKAPPWAGSPQRGNSSCPQTWAVSRRMPRCWPSPSGAATSQSPSTGADSQ